MHESRNEASAEKRPKNVLWRLLTLGMRSTWWLPESYIIDPKLSGNRPSTGRLTWATPRTTAEELGATDKSGSSITEALCRGRYTCHTVTASPLLGTRQNIHGLRVSARIAHLKMKLHEFAAHKARLQSREGEPTLRLLRGHIRHKDLLKALQITNAKLFVFDKKWSPSLQIASRPFIRPPVTWDQTSLNELPDERMSQLIPPD